MRITRTRTEKFAKCISPPRIRSQSAMEYLMTYGWAILIIAIVLGALFQLGVFSGIGVPMAQAGNCQVIKAGSGFTQVVSLEGECQGQEPEYVGNFNGASSYVYALLGSYFGRDNPLSASAWTYIGPNTNGPIFGVTDSPPGGDWNMPFLSADGLTVYGWIWGLPSLQFTVPSSGWYYLAITYNPSGSGQEIFYVNGKKVASGRGQYAPSGSADYWTTYIPGAEPAGVNNHLLGEMANVQAYNTSLSANEIQALYVEGIGGAPINPQNIVGWWPLNGNGNDYSGNNNNGQATSITYISAWTNGYTPP